MSSKTTINWQVYNMWCYLNILSLYWKIDVFQQTVAKVYDILNHNLRDCVNLYDIVV